MLSPAVDFGFLGPSGTSDSECLEETDRWEDLRLILPGAPARRSLRLNLWPSPLSLWMEGVYFFPKWPLLWGVEVLGRRLWGAVGRVEDGAGERRTGGLCAGSGLSSCSGESDMAVGANV